MSGIGWWAEMFADTVDVDPVGISDSLIVGDNRVFVDAAGLSDSFTLDTSQFLVEPVGLTDSVAVGYGTRFEPSVTDPAGLSDSLALDAGRFVTDPAGLSDSLALNAGRSATDPVGVSDSATAVTTYNLQIVGTPNTAVFSSGTATIPLPPHQAGDLLIICGFDSAAAASVVPPAAGGTVPTWIDDLNPAAANSCVCRVVHAVATANNHTSGSWGNIAGLTAIVLRGQHTTPIGGKAASGGTGTTMTAPAVPMTNTDGSSKLLHLFGGRGIAAGGWAAAAAGYTKLASAFISTGQAGVCVNSKDITTSDGSVSQGTQSTTIGYFAATVEIRAH